MITDNQCEKYNRVDVIYCRQWQRLGFIIQGIEANWSQGSLSHTDHYELQRR